MYNTIEMQSTAETKRGVHVTLLIILVRPSRRSGHLANWCWTLLAVLIRALRWHPVTHASSHPLLASLLTPLLTPFPAVLADAHTNEEHSQIA